MGIRGQALWALLIVLVATTNHVHGKHPSSTAGQGTGGHVASPSSSSSRGYIPPPMPPVISSTGVAAGSSSTAGWKPTPHGSTGTHHRASSTAGWKPTPHGSSGVSGTTGSHHGGSSTGGRASTGSHHGKSSSTGGSFHASTGSRVRTSSSTGASRHTSTGGSYHTSTGTHHASTGSHHASTGSHHASTGTHHASTGSHHTSTGGQEQGSTGTQPTYGCLFPTEISHGYAESPGVYVSDSATEWMPNVLNAAECRALCVGREGCVAYHFLWSEQYPSSNNCQLKFSSPPDLHAEEYPSKEWIVVSGVMNGVPAVVPVNQTVRIAHCDKGYLPSEPAVCLNGGFWSRPLSCAAPGSGCMFPASISNGAVMALGVYVNDPRSTMTRGTVARECREQCSSTLGCVAWHFMNDWGNPLCQLKFSAPPEILADPYPSNNGLVAGVMPLVGGRVPVNTTVAILYCDAGYVATAPVKCGANNHFDAAIACVQGWSSKSGLDNGASAVSRVSWPLICGAVLLALMQ